MCTNKSSLRLYVRESFIVVELRPTVHVNDMGFSLSKLRLVHLSTRIFNLPKKCRFPSSGLILELAMNQQNAYFSWLNSE